jgi:hypothetical protein
MYVLPFDHGTVSAGFVLADPAARERAARRAPAKAWEEILGRYPTLAEQFGGARPERPVEFIPRLQHRAGSAAGRGWALKVDDRECSAPWREPRRGDGR